ncbi:UNKNOWN [Stylonychia lemnae]|uniref:Uncharacterized protein n=1 Tax=Stylonychia lemnae TaxID=5949 RepID=A0A078AEF2_STYLE|nr:UNKNOWN [Stylonychia lemnae]|eukprot:CDW80585.1 UNKNOWN [Stylonychia lemnae]
MDHRFDYSQSDEKKPSTREDLTGDDFQENQIINEDKESEKHINFYLVTNNSHLIKTNFKLNLKNVGSQKKPIKMDRLDDNIFYARVKFTLGDLTNMNELKYSYSKFEAAENLAENEESEQERSKSKKFMNLSTLFDIYYCKKNYMLQIDPNKEYYEIILKFFITNFDKTDRHFGRPTIFKEYLEFFNYQSNNSFPYSQTFKIITDEYNSRSENTRLNIYILELFSYLDMKKIKQRTDHFKKMMQKMLELQYGRLRQMILDTQYQSNHQGVLQGFQILIQFEPLLGMEMLDSMHVIMDKQKYLKSLNFVKEDVKFAKYKSNIKFAKTMSFYEENVIQLLIANALKQSISLEALLYNVEEMERYTTGDTILNSAKELKDRLSISNTANIFVKNHIERILEVDQLKIVFKKEIKETIFQNLKYHNQNTTNIQYLIDNPDILGVKYLQDIVQIEENQYLQENFKVLIIKTIETSGKKKKLDFEKIQTILTINFQNNCKACKNLSEYFQVFSLFIDLVKAPLFNQIGQFNINFQLAEFKKHLQNVLSTSFTIEQQLDSLLKARPLFRNELFKIEQITEVILEELKMISPQDSIIIKTVFKVIFPDFKLVYPEFRAIGNASLKMLNELYEIEKRNIYEDEVIYYAMNISQTYGSNDFLDKLKRSVEELIKKMKDRTITLSEINKTIVAKKKNLQNIIQLYEPGFDFNIIKELRKTIENYQDQIKKYQNYLNWAQKSSILFEKQSYQQNLIDIQSSEILEARKVDSEEFWRYFQEFKNVDQYFTFRESVVFENLFHQMPEEIGKLVVQLEEKKNSETGKHHKSMEQFDFLSQEILFKNLCTKHFRNLASYPSEAFKQINLQKYWKNVKIEQVEKELEIIKSYMIKYESYPVDYVFNQNLVDDIKTYQNQKSIQTKSIIFIELQTYAAKIPNFNYEENETYQKLQNFLLIVEQNSPDENLSNLAKKISEIEEIFSKLIKNFQINWDHLEEYKSHKDVFDFCVQNVGLDFNTLYEHLDEYSFLNSKTIENIGAVSYFFQQVLEILLIYEKNNYESLLQKLSELMKKEIKQDPDFKQKLMNCNSNLSAIKQISSSQKNASENTLQIIEQALQQGTFIWEKKNTKFDFKLEIIIEREKNSFDEFSTLANSQNISEQNTLITKLEYDKEKIFQHSSRAKLYIHSKKSNPSNQQKVQENDNIFTKAVDLSKDINNMLQQLYQYGHKDYQNDSKEYIRIKIYKDQIVQDLQKHYNDYVKEFIQWKQQLSQYRNNYYFLNYVPNHLVASLILISDEEFAEVQQKLIRYKIFKKSITFENGTSPLQQMQLSWNEENNIYSDIDENIFEYQEDQNYSLQSGKALYRLVSDDLQLIKAVMSIFAIGKMLPVFDRLLFCNEDTQYSEVETFINRSFLFPNCKKSLKPFVIVNFQKLAFIIQYEVYDFLKKYQGQSNQQEINNFTLYILCV